jgi:hypothetical protein
MTPEDTYYLLDCAPGYPPSEVERIILQGNDPKWAFYFARKYKGGQWKAAEAIIRTNTQWACLYALLVGKRWRALEPAVFDDPDNGANYVRKFFKDSPFENGKPKYRSIDDSLGGDVDDP